VVPLGPSGPGAPQAHGPQHFPFVPLLPHAPVIPSAQVHLVTQGNQCLLLVQELLSHLLDLADPSLFLRKKLMLLGPPLTAVLLSVAVVSVSAEMQCRWEVPLLG